MHRQQTTAGRSKMHRRHNVRESSDAQLRCNALTVSKRQAISQLIARRKRSAVSSALPSPPCLAEFNRLLCCLYVANFVVGRLIIKPRKRAKPCFSHYYPIFIVDNGTFVLLRWNLMSESCTVLTITITMQFFN